MLTDVNGEALFVILAHHLHSLIWSFSRSEEWFGDAFAATN